MKVKNKIYIIGVIIVIVSIFKEVTFALPNSTVDFKNLEKKENLLYLKGEQVPYSGEVVVFYKNGTPFQRGTLLNGKTQGELIQYYEDGSIYKKSSYKSGLLDGIEKIYANENGELSETTMYKNNQKNGWWTRYWSEESKSRGQFIDGKENGKWEEYRFGKLALEGDMVDGYKNGEWKRYYQGTDILSNVSTFKMGSIDGKSIEYHENGKIKLIQYYNMGESVGTWKRFYDDGSLMWEESYVNGSINGEAKSYKKNGELEATYTYVNGELNGISKIYHEGWLLREEFYKDGLLHGKSINFSSSGHISSESFYEAGKLDEKIIYIYDFFGNVVETNIIKGNLDS